MNLLIFCAVICHFWSVDAQKRHDAADFPNTLKGVGLKARLTPYWGKSFAAITDPIRMGDLMRAIMQGNRT